MRIVEVVGFRMQREQLFSLEAGAHASKIIILSHNRICLLANSAIASTGQQLETTIAIREEKGHLSPAADRDLLFGLRSDTFCLQPGGGKRLHHEALLDICLL